MTQLIFFRFTWSRQDFKIGPFLGSGRFGRVYLASEKSSEYLVALKMMKKDELTKARVERQVFREIDIHSRLQHPHVLQLLTYFHDEVRVYLVLELAAGGCVYNELRRTPNKRFDERVTAKYVHQVADALEYCHAQNVIHRDLKPENLLLTQDGDVKLADFGWSVHTTITRRTRCGTLDYMPPEIINSQKYDKRVDHWSLGVLVYEFLVGTPPFYCKSQASTNSRIKNIDFKWPELVTPGAKDLITRLVKLESSERLSMAEVMKHEWIVENMDSGVKKDEKLVAVCNDGDV